MKLIDVDDAIEAIHSHFKSEVDAIPKHTDFGVLTKMCDLILDQNAKLCKAIDSIPAVDAVEVVRCRECMYSASIVDAITHKRNGLWCALLDLENLEEDFYCKDGQRREEEDDG